MKACHSSCKMKGGTLTQGCQRRCYTACMVTNDVHVISCYNLLYQHANMHMLKHTLLPRQEQQSCNTWVRITWSCTWYLEGSATQLEQLHVGPHHVSYIVQYTHQLCTHLHSQNSWQWPSKLICSTHRSSSIDQESLNMHWLGSGVGTNKSGIEHV